MSMTIGGRVQKRIRIKVESIKIAIKSDLKQNEKSFATNTMNSFVSYVQSSPSRN